MAGNIVKLPMTQSMYKQVVHSALVDTNLLFITNHAKMRMKER